MEIIVDSAIELLSYLMKMNLLVFRVDSIYSKENMNSKVQRKKKSFFNRIKYAEQKKILFV